jgi:FkbM family methyltransferase
MLIPLDEIVSKHKPKLGVVLHIGAYECEEANDYQRHNAQSVIWLEANPEMVSKMKARGHIVHQAVASDKDGDLVTFNITHNAHTNDSQSSSILSLGTHSQHYPFVTVVKSIQLRTTRVETLGDSLKWDWSKFGFLNLDIQGAELLALKGLGERLRHFSAIYAEVNVEQVYRNCALVGEIDMYLSSFGFVRVETRMTGAGWGDALYIRKVAAPTPVVFNVEVKVAATPPIPSFGQASTDLSVSLLVRHLGRHGQLAAQMFQISAADCLAAQTNAFLSTATTADKPKVHVTLSPAWAHGRHFVGFDRDGPRAYVATLESTTLRAPLVAPQAWPSVDTVSALALSIFGSQTQHKSAVELVGQLQNVSQLSIPANADRVLRLFEPVNGVLDRANARLAAAGVDPLMTCAIVVRGVMTGDALSKLIHRVTDKLEKSYKIVVFTKANKNVPDCPKNVVVMTPSPSAESTFDPAVVDLIALSLCAAIVPMDSKFGWWAAYLSRGVAALRRRNGAPSTVIHVPPTRLPPLPSWITVSEETPPETKMKGLPKPTEIVPKLNPTTLGDVFQEFGIQPFYINLQRRTDRKVLIEAEFKRMGLSSCTRFDAITHTNGAVGCSKSHCGVLKLALLQKTPLVLVLEDDFTFHPDADLFRRNLAGFLRSKRSKDKEGDFDFDCAVLTTCIPVLRIPDGELARYQSCQPPDITVRVLEASSAAAYLVPARYIPTLLHCFEASVPLLESTGQHWTYACDRAWAPLQRRDRFFVFRPLLGYQRPSPSDT